MSNIEWCDTTWNPVRGCSRVSSGCENCYAERQALRTAGPGGAYENLVRKVNGHPVWTGEVRCLPELLDRPLRWRKPRRVFVNSMSDLFHERVPFEFVAAVFAVMSVTTRHTYQILTKRPERMREFFRWALAWYDDVERAWVPPAGPRPYPDRITEHWPDHLPWSPAGDGGSGYDNCGPAFPFENVWLGVSVEDQATADERIPILLDTPAAVRWVSAEPLLERVTFATLINKRCVSPPHPFPASCREPDHDIRGIDWLVAGGESGPGARPCDVAWIRSIVEQCLAAQVSCFVKQLGARPEARLSAQAEAELQAWAGRGPRSRERIVLRDRKGGDPSEWPADLRVREWPDSRFGALSEVG